MSMYRTQIGSNIETAVSFLERGEIVGIPTETVYGLAGNIFEEKAINRIYRAKNRPSNNPLIVHLPMGYDLLSLVDSPPPVLQKLMERFCPGPLTFLLPKKEAVPNWVTAGSPNVAIRFPDHPVTQALLKRVSFPLAAPSANKSNKISPTSAQQVYSELSGEIPYILDGGACKKGVESTIISVSNDTITIHRPGSITKEQLAEFCESVIENYERTHGNAFVPGQFKKHYSPTTPFFLFEKEALEKWKEDTLKSVFLTFKDPMPGVAAHNQRVLSPSGNLEEAAANLYSYLHYLDNLNAEAIIGELVPENGVGIAINNRLRKAAVPFSKE